MFALLWPWAIILASIAPTIYSFTITGVQSGVINATGEVGAIKLLADIYPISE